MATAKGHAPRKTAAKASAPSRQDAAAPQWIDEPAPPAPAWPQPPHAQPPAPRAAPFDERNYALLLHLSALAGLIIGFFFVGPLVMWLVKKDESAFVDRHGRAAMDFHLSMIIYAVGGGLLIGIIAIFTLGIGVLLLLPVIILVAIAYGIVLVVFPILAGVKANQGHEYDYPLSFRMLRRPPAAAFHPSR
jgi:uncharacterized Tic20 family protein